MDNNYHVKSISNSGNHLNACIPTQVTLSKPQIIFFIRRRWKNDHLKHKPAPCMLSKHGTVQARESSDDSTSSKYHKLKIYMLWVKLIYVTPHKKFNLRWRMAVIRNFKTTNQANSFYKLPVKNPQLPKLQIISDQNYQIPSISIFVSWETLLLDNLDISKLCNGVNT